MDCQLPDEKVTAAGDVFILRDKIASLKTALLEAHPTLPVLLRDIHKQIRADPELITTLGEEEIGVLIKSLSKQVGVELVATTPKPKSETASLKKLLKAAGANALDLF